MVNTSGTVSGHIRDIENIRNFNNFLKNVPDCPG
nr:MAG TPA: hypothetical protein [Caudoviricetes sp.]